MLRRSTAIAIVSGAAVLAGTSVAAGFGTFESAQTKTMARPSSTRWLSAT